MKVLIAGGAGFIGSTIASACVDAGITPVVLDNLSTGRREFTADRIFYQGDIADGDLIDRIFAEHPDISVTVHLAALIVVPDSVARPLHYYRENVSKTVDLLTHLLRNGCHQLIFSSSAAIYEPRADLTVDEDSAVAPNNPYARTKAMMEQVLADVAAASPLRALSLRYFNPIGSDPKLRSGLQIKKPTHALGVMLRSYTEGTPFPITGTDYPTRDGSGIRDYIHVWDLAQAHVAAIERMPQLFSTPGSAPNLVINLGTGRGTTVRELVAAFRSVVPESLEVIETGRRPGDAPGCYTRCDRAQQLLGWKAKYTLEEGIGQALAWLDVRDTIIP